MYINLIEKLTETDKKRITNYVLSYGAAEGFIGVDKWLQDWSHANQKLYKLLGEQFIIKRQVKLEKDKELLKNQFEHLIRTTDVFDTLQRIEVRYISERAAATGKIPFEMNKDVYFDSKFSNVIDSLSGPPWRAWGIYYNDKIEVGGKIVAPFSGKNFQIPVGMKPMKAIKKLIDFFKAEGDSRHFSDSTYYTLLNNIDKEFEDFRIKASVILNDRYITGNLCISIHPLDYMTMSDNSMDWSSCMSWVGEGCYRVGTIEMMNSNNALCCYIEGKEPFYFRKDLVVEKGETKSDETKKLEEECSPEYTWNNKKWRVLCYINKDIVMTGKSYPYYNEKLNKELLSILIDLAGSNLSWHYTYGPELYMDMKHIYSRAAVDNNRRWIRYKETIKHNIIWDTHGMYNDMLNANDYDYWCYRNKVKHNKIYSVSGKATCLCCGNSIINEADYHDDDYNERYENCGSTICLDCASTWCGCDVCLNISSKDKHYNIEVDGKKLRVCEKCFDSLVVKCPCCGKPMWATPLGTYEYSYRKLRGMPVSLPGISKVYHGPVLPSAGCWNRWQSHYLLDNNEIDDNNYFIAEYLFMCNTCLALNMPKIVKKKKTFYQGWILDNEEVEVPVFQVFDGLRIDKMHYRDLEHPKPEDFPDGKIELKEVGWIPD